MGFPITKTVTLAWDGVDWRDTETGNVVTGINKLGELAICGMCEGVIRWIGENWYHVNGTNLIHAAVPREYPPLHTHPFDKSRDVSMELVEQMIRKAIESQRLDVQESFAVAPPAESLVSYRYLREMINIISSEINRVEHRVMRLEGSDV